MNALTAEHDPAVQMIDTSIMRVHQHGACIAGNKEQLMGRSRGGLLARNCAAEGFHDSYLLPPRSVLTAHQPSALTLASAW